MDPISTVTLAIVGGSIFGSLTSTFEITQEDGDRIIAFAANRFGIDENGNPRTPQQCVDMLAEDFLKELIAKVQLLEREHAAATAAAGVTPIPFVKQAAT